MGKKRGAGTELRAGAARADITPALGIQLAGDIGRMRPAEEIRDRLYANALVLESGGRRCAWIALDLLALSNGWAAEIKRRIQDRFQLAPESVVLHIEQNHATPALGHTFIRDTCPLMPPEYPWLRGGDDRYNEPCVQAILSAVDGALRRLQPVRLSAGRRADGRVAFNRRFILRDGTALCHPPLCDPRILQAEGPTDPEVGVASLCGADGTPVVTLLHHTCHPCHGYPHRYVIGDWPGAWAERIRAKTGGEALVVNGCCGNIHHCNHLDPDAYKRQDYQRMAEALAETSGVVLDNMEPLGAVPLAWERTVLRLPLRRLTKEVVSQARRLVKAHPQPKFLDAEKTRVDWDWVYAVATLDLEATEREDPFCDYEIQAFRLGDLALVTLMGEPFVEVQLQIKLASPARYTFVAHFCNGYVGYVPTAEALQRGGYETRTANWSKFQPEALSQIGAAAIRLLRRLFPPSRGGVSPASLPG